MSRSGAVNDLSPEGLACSICKDALSISIENFPSSLRCPAGHVIGIDKLLTEQPKVAQQTLWAVVHTVERKAAFLRKITMEAITNGHPTMAMNFEGDLRKIEGCAQALRNILTRGGDGSAEIPNEG